MTLFLIALFVGIVVGLIPGFGLLSTLVLLYPFLLSLDPLQILTFYAVMGGASQFTGSITASVMGVAGEASSVPATKEGPLLFSSGRGPSAISNAAIGSMLGTIIVVGILYFTVPHLSTVVENFYNNNIQTILFLIVSLIIILSGSNKLYLNVIYFLIGCFLANIGLQRYYIEPMTFGITDLSLGIPFITLALGLYSLPQLYVGIIDLDTRNLRSLLGCKFNGLLESFLEFYKYIKSALRGSIIGLFTGLVPGLSTILASNFSYTVEKYLRIKNKTYNTKGDMPCLISAETANNSAFLVSLLPLMLLGIPIMGSEAVVLNLIEQTGTAVGINTLMKDNYFSIISLYYLLGGFIALLLSWHGSKFFMRVYLVPKNILLASIFILALTAVFLFGCSEGNHVYNFIWLTVFLSFGFLLRRTDTSIILFSFLIYPFLESNLIRFSIINF